MAVASTTPHEVSTPDCLIVAEGYAAPITGLTRICHQLSVNAGWYQDPNTKLMVHRNVPEMLMLTVSEIAEAMEAVRKNKRDDHLPHRAGVEVELADAVIRICDLAGCLGLDLGAAIVEKLHYNANRADHRLETRAADGGKQF